jgi:hypothetical protein
VVLRYTFKWLYVGHRSEQDTCSYEAFLLRMTDILTSQNVDLSSWDTLYIELLVNPEILTLYIYGPTFGNAESRLVLFAAYVSALNQCRKFFCVTVMCKHFASYQDYTNYRWDLIR